MRWRVWNGNLEELIDLEGLFLGRKVLGERFNEAHQEEGAFETLVKDVPVVPEVVPGQVATGFARRYRRYDEHRVLRSHLIRHGKSQYLDKEKKKK